MLNDLWLLISAIVILIGLLTSQGLLIVVGSLVIIVWMLTKFWDRYAFQDVSHSRTLSHGRAFIGDVLEYTVTLSNEKILPLIWVDIQDTFPSGLDLTGTNLRGSAAAGSKEHRITTSLLPYQRVSWKYRLHCNSRGYHRIGPVRLRSGDIFGFTAAEVQLPEVKHLLVYPRVFELQQLLFPAEHPFGEFHGSRRLYQDPSRFLSLRDYYPTDPMKHVDWKATARRSALQTKTFEPVVSLNVLIALNAATGEHAWQGSNRRLFERSVTVAASVAKYCADRGQSFGLVSNSVAVFSGKWVNVPASSSNAQIGSVLESLALAGTYAVASLPEVLRTQRSSFRSGTTVALVTAVMTPALAEEVAEIRDQGYQVIVFYTGDRGPRITLPEVPIYRMGRVLEALERDDQVLAD
ncbi:MAG TPA: DUF58 domain-containing protein [Dehalococcoidia bacterium]|nr:DUF58 domain-containing protein [Dehalococcoidia bacterium]